MVIALRDAAGDLKLVVWGLDGIGLLRRLDDSDTQAGAVARVALAPHSADRYVTAVESSAGTLKLIDWHIR